MNILIRPTQPSSKYLLSKKDIIYVSLSFSDDQNRDILCQQNKII